MENSSFNSSVNPTLKKLPIPPAASEVVRASKRTLYVFDFDGTLAELKDHAEDVRFDPEVKSQIQLISQKVPVLICSGRGVAGLKFFFTECPHLEFIGNHGAEWEVSGSEGLGREFKRLTPPAWSEWYARAVPPIREAAQIHGGDFEDKGGSITIHFRNSGADFWREKRAWLESLGGNYGHTVQVMSGICSWNLIPEGFSKGVTLGRYVMKYGYERVVYFGDEPTDETVFANKELPLIGVRVGEGPTSAHYRLPDVNAVHQWVAELARAVAED
ncbi:MAG: trehalose-phosphatase [Methylotenera sp.]|nr:trehalose-phosphatase [Oligoflexia bacterium]